MSVGVSVEREQNDFSKNVCGKYPYFDGSHQSTNSNLGPVGYVDYEDSSTHTLPEESSQDFTRQHSSASIKAKTSQSRAQNKYESEYGTWYSGDTIVVNQTGYETQGFAEYSNMMPPYYASESKYIELWVQCPRQPGINSCEHFSQPIFYSECCEPTTNGMESLDWENNEWVYGDGSSRNANAQVCCLGSSDNHEEQKYGDSNIDCELSNSKTCESLSFKEAEIQNSTEESLYRVTADTKYEEVEARMLHSEFNGRLDHEEITKHLTKSVSISSESIKIEVLNHNPSLDFSQNPGPLVTEKNQRVKSQRHRRKSKIPIDVGSVLNPNGTSSTDAKNAVQIKHEVSLMPHEPLLSDCDRFEIYLNRDLIKRDSYDGYVGAEHSISGDEIFSKKMTFECQNSKSPIKCNSQNESGHHQIRQQKSIPTTSERRAKATADVKPSITSSAKPLKASNKIDTLCKAVTKYIPEMCQEQKLIAEQLILTLLGNGVKNLLSKSTVLVTKESQIPHCSNGFNLKSNDRTTQCPETRPSGNSVHTASDNGDGIWSGGAKSKRTRRRPRWKKKKTGLDQQLQKVPDVNS